jgi:hypothetical protein
MVEDHRGDAGCREHPGEVGDEVGDLAGPAMGHDDARRRRCGARSGEEQATQRHAFCVEFDVFADVCHMHPPWNCAWPSPPDVPTAFEWHPRTSLALCTQY